MYWMWAIVWLFVICSVVSTKNNQTKFQKYLLVIEQIQMNTKEIYSQAHSLVEVRPWAVFHPFWRNLLCIFKEVKIVKEVKRNDHFRHFACSDVYFHFVPKALPWSHQFPVTWCGTSSVICWISVFGGCYVIVSQLTPITLIVWSGSVRQIKDCIILGWIQKNILGLLYMYWWRIVRTCQCFVWKN